MLVIDRARRMISGRAVPYGVVAHPKLALPRRFPAGSLIWDEPQSVKLLVEHNHSLAVGKAIALTETPDGLWAVFQVARGERGSWALELAAATHSGLSIGTTDDDFRITVDGVQEYVSARIVEVSLTPNPVFR